MPNKEDTELEATRLYLLKAIRDREKNTNPSEDAVRYAMAYSYLVNAWLAEKQCPSMKVSAE